MKLEAEGRTTSIGLHQRPALSRAARLRFDAHSQGYVLLSPERGLRLNATATEVVQRCTGELTVGEIVQEVVAELLATCARDPDVCTSQVTADVLELLTQLHERRLLALDSQS